MKICGLSQWFGDFCALESIDLTVEAGEKIVICGPSGSGKTTLLRCINQLDQVQEKGRVFLYGEDVCGNGVHVRQNVGTVFQQFHLFPHLNILENCTLAPMHVLGLSASEAKERAEHYLAQVQIPEQVCKYPKQLSGGQQQRVAIARALCMEPKVLLFDEPTSSLDPEMVGKVLAVIEDLAERGMTMICVTHEMGFARKVADRVVFMDEGRIQEDSPCGAFFRAPRSKRAATFLGEILRS